LGFKKIKAPTEIYKILKEFWENNKNEISSPEEWSHGDAAVNNWENPSYVIDINNQTLQGGGSALRHKIFHQVEEIISQWTNQTTLTTSSCYGIRVYTHGAILTSHVDRLPLVSSAIINVDQDVDEPWPLEVIGHDGRVYNITMEPGDMILYESHSVIHGRPYPLKGRYYANIFVHFAPEEEEGIPSYIIPGSPEDEYRRNQGIYTNEAIEENDLETLIEFSLNNSTRSLLFSRDMNGYTPFHKAARLGRTKILKFLWSVGVDTTATVLVDGLSALDIAIGNLGEGHGSVEFLRNVFENPDFEVEFLDDSDDSEDGSGDDSKDGDSDDSEDGGSDDSEDGGSSDSEDGSSGDSSDD